MSVVLSPNMSLPVPQVGSQPGPTYAENINSCLSLIDSHDHASGSGVQITPAGLDISSDLDFQNNNITSAKSVRMDAQGSPLSGASDLDCIYVSGVDLYYNDGNGNQVRITQSGGVAGSPGSISNLTSPASASYVSCSAKFVWPSAANVAATLDCRNIILRNSTASSNGLTLSPPNAMGSNYTITLPALPASQNILTIDSGGAMSTWAVDGITLDVVSSTLKIKDSGVGTTQIADGAVTPAKKSALGQQISSSCNNFSTASTSFVDITNLTVTITTTGRPVFIGLISDGSGNDTSMRTTVSNSRLRLKLLRGATELARPTVAGTDSGGSSIVGAAPYHIDPVAAGTYTYKWQALTSDGSGVQVNYYKMVAYEL